MEELQEYGKEEKRIVGKGSIVKTILFVSIVVLLVVTIYVSNSNEPIAFFSGENSNEQEGVFGLANWGTEANVTLLSPANGSTQDFNPIVFNATLEISTTAYITNATLYTNESGVWQEVNETAQYQTTPTDTENAIYSSFDEFEGSEINSSKWTNSTGNPQSSVVVSGGELRVKASAPSSASSPGSAQANSIGLFNTGDLITFNLTSIRHSSSFASDDGDFYIDLGSTNILSYAFNSASEEFGPLILQVFYDGSNYHYRNDTNYTGYGPWTTTGSGGQIEFRATTVATGGFGSSTSIDVEWVRYTFPENQSWERHIESTEGAITWNVLGCDSDGDCGFAENNFTFNINVDQPVISLFNPLGILDYNKVGENETINFSVSDTSLESCWFEYGGVNTTIPSCSNSTFNLANVSVQNIVQTLNLWANDSVGNIGFNTTTLDYKVLEIDNEYNNSTFETELETFSLNLSSNASLSSVTLLYNGTYNYTLNNLGSIWNTSLDIPTDKVQNNLLQYEFVYGGENIYSNTFEQNVSGITFALCNATLQTPFLNLTFKDENNLTSVSASIPSSTWEYYLGSGNQKKTYIFSNSTENLNYAFCFSENETLSVSPSVGYASSGYPQRTYIPGIISLTNSTTNTILYLLSQIDGIYSTFVTVTSQSVLIPGANVLIQRDILGSLTTVAQGTTDSAGSFTAFLNPNFEHTIYASKTGFGSSNSSIFPTQTSYTIVLTQLTNFSYISNTDGMLWAFFPSVGILNSSANDFGFNITDYYGTLDACRIDLLNNDKTVTLASATFNTTNGSICSVSTSFTVNDTYPQIKGRLLIDVGSGYQILEEDAFWAFYSINTTGLTFSDWFDSLKTFDLRYFAGGSDEVKEQHREFTMVLLFFLFVTIVCAVLNVAGWDIQTNGGMIFLIGLFVWFASIPGFLNLAGISPFGFIDKFFVAIVYSFFMVGYATRNFV